MNENLLRLYYKIETKRYNYLMARWKRHKKLYLDEESCRVLSVIEKFRNPMYSKTFCDEISKAMENPPCFSILGLEDVNERIALLGEGERFNYCVSLLDNSRHPHIIAGKDERLISDSDAIMLVLDEKTDGRYKDYIMKKYKARRILYKADSLPNGLWVGTCGNQYFDVFESREDEIIVDAGAFDGTTEAQFFCWGGEHIKKIYSFEMDPANGKRCLEFYQKNGLLDKVVFINKGTGDKEQTIYLDDTSIGGRGSTQGNGTVAGEITTIDSEVGDDRITFIKMDVEGAELASLKGAAKTIKRNKPRLAICIYHKDFDAYELAQYIHRLVPSYRFRVRHYTSVFWETVLYAEVPD